MNVDAHDDPGETAPRSILRFERLLVGDQWRRDVCVEVGEDGRIASLAPAEIGAGGERVAGWTVPGVPNVHSHAFQRAMAGLAEGGGGTDRRASSFWRWREVMYEFLRRLSPDDVEAVAAQAYVEMLKAGFTCVGEFHYLHHPPGGGAYDDEAETSRRILRAADTAGIGLVHMPVVYETGGFGGEPLRGGQLRFRMDLEGVRRLLEGLERDIGRPGDAQAGRRRLGWAVHSLRAVSRESFDRIADFVGSRESGLQSPVHIHVAEQEREVRECLAARGARPVEWLLDNAPVDERWCLVHATHVDDAEVRGTAARGAVVGLCPTTEANLGDGLFPLGRFVGCGGRFGIGTDSHVSRSPAEELRVLEYGQRLTLRTRSVLGRAADQEGALAGAGGALLDRAWRDGAQALGWDGGRAAAGCRADFVVLDSDHPALVGRDEHAVLDSWVFSGTDNPVSHVFVGGVRVIEDGRHAREEEVARAFREAARRLGRIRSPSGA